MCLDVLTLRLRTWNVDRLQNILASESEDHGTRNTEGQRKGMRTLVYLRYRFLVFILLVLNLHISACSIKCN